MNTSVFVSICIPTYARAGALKRALESIDIKRHISDLEIVVSENCSPLQNETREVVKQFSDSHEYLVNYYENSTNEQFAGNIKRISERALGKWIILLGDDDVFVPCELDNYIDYLMNNPDIGYVIHSHRILNDNGSWSIMSHYNDNAIFDPSEESYIRAYRLAVPVSGITFRNDWFRLLCDLSMVQHSGYIHQIFASELCYNHKSAAYANPIVSYIPPVGNYKEEQVYADGREFVVEDIESRIKLLNDSFIICRYMDEKYGLSSTAKIIKEYSKYSFPILSYVPCKSKDFKRYTQALKQMRLNSTPYYYIYLAGLRILGKERCFQLIDFIKHIRGGTTPNL